MSIPKIIVLSLLIAFTFCTKCLDGTVCPGAQTCCPTPDGMGCCPYVEGVCCSDLLHCCPRNTLCKSERCLSQSVTFLDYSALMDAAKIQKRKSFELLLNWDASLKCIMNAKPDMKDIIELAEAIKEKDYEKATTLIADLIRNESTVIIDCLKLAFSAENRDWDAIVKCLSEYASLIPEILELIEAIKKEDYNTAVTLAISLIEKGYTAVKECFHIPTSPDEIISFGMEKFNSPEIGVAINWDEFLKCIQEAQPVAIKILELIEAINKKDYAKALDLVFELISEGSDLISKCFKLDNAQSFDWDKIIKCLSDAAPMVPQIMALIKEISLKHYPQAIVLAMSLIKEGYTVVKECFHSSSLIGTTINFVSFNWKEFIICVWDKEILHKIKLIIFNFAQGNIDICFQMLNELIHDSSHRVVDCIKNNISIADLEK